MCGLHFADFLGSRVLCIDLQGHLVLGVVADDEGGGDAFADGT